jgi:hypothetical protein
LTATPATGRFDVRATGELCSSFDAAEERARLLCALNGDRDLCSALLCGEEQLLCSGVEWGAAQAFAALMRDCGVVTEVVGQSDRPPNDTGCAFDADSAFDADNGTRADSSAALATFADMDAGAAPVAYEERQIPAPKPPWGAQQTLDAESFALALQAIYGGTDPGIEGERVAERGQGAGAGQAEMQSDSPVAIGELKPLLALVESDAESAQQRAQKPERAEPAGSTWATRARRPQVYEAEMVAEPVPAVGIPAVTRADTMVSSGGGDIPLFLLEADVRERDQRRRLRRRWGLASAAVVVLASLALFSGGERTLNSQQAYVHLLASPVRAEVDGVVAELLVRPQQLLQAGEAMAVIAPEGGVLQRHIEAAPVAGTVDQIIVHSGQKVQRGQPLLTLAQPGSAYLLVYFSPEQLQQLPERAPVRIELDDFPGQPLLGRLATFQRESSIGESRSRRRAVRVDFEDRTPLIERLRSGMAGSVTVRFDNGVD